MANLFANRFRIDRELGRGAFGVVYLAFDTRLQDRPVALKLLHPGLDADPVVVGQFQREAGMLARLEHPAIVPIYDAGAEEGRRYLVMRYVPGRSLAQVVADEGPQPPERVLAWLQQIAGGLDYAHGQGVLHRDLKPGNLLLDEGRSQVLISDFGLARAVMSSGGSVSMSQGMMTGTALYMAPEVILGQPLAAAGDLYSLGCSLYELLGGKPPFTGDNVVAVTHQHVHSAPRPLPLAGDLGEALAEQVMALLAKAPEDRPATAMQAYTAVKQGLREREEERQVRETEAARKAEQERQQRAAEEAARQAAQERQRRAAEEAAQQAAAQEEAQRAEAERQRQEQAAAEQARQDAARREQEKAATEQRQGEEVGRPLWQRWPLWAGLAVVAVAGILLLRACGGGILTSIPQVAEPRPAMAEPPTPLSPTAIPAGTITMMTSEKDGMDMVYVPAGGFLMGSAAGAQDGEKPPHRVTLDGYWIDRVEVTNAQFARFVAETKYVTEAEKAGTGWAFNGSSWEETNGSDWQHPRGPASRSQDNHPVVQVSWNDAVAYCAWAGRRLPSEAEWEKAARGTDGRKYPWGNAAPDATLANFGMTVGDATPVRSYPAGASPYGALDMAGNVWEWVEDWWAESYYADSPVANPPGPATGAYRVVRGGSWYSASNLVRSAGRVSNSPGHRVDEIGFRCAHSSLPMATTANATLQPPAPSPTPIPLVVADSLRVADIELPLPGAGTPAPDPVDRFGRTSANGDARLGRPLPERYIYYLEGQAETSAGEGSEWVLVIPHRSRDATIHRYVLKVPGAWMASPPRPDDTIAVIGRPVNEANQQGDIALEPLAVLAPGDTPGSAVPLWLKDNNASTWISANTALWVFTAYGQGGGKGLGVETPTSTLAGAPIALWGGWAAAPQDPNTIVFHRLDPIPYELQNGVYRQPDN